LTPDRVGAHLSLQLDPLLGDLVGLAVLPLLLDGQFLGVNLLSALALSDGVLACKRRLVFVDDACFEGIEPAPREGQLALRPGPDLLPLETVDLAVTIALLVCLSQLFDRFLIVLRLFHGTSKALAGSILEDLQVIFIRLLVVISQFNLLC